MVQLVHIDAVDGLEFEGKGRVWQEAPGVPGGSEAGDHFGASVATLDIRYFTTSQVAIGVPGEDLGSVRDAGDVTLASVDPFSTAGRSYTLLTQGATGGLGGARETDDHVGATVVYQGLAQRNADSGTIPNPKLNRNLVIGVPGEDLGQVVNSGVALIYNPRREALPLTPRAAGP